MEIFFGNVSHRGCRPSIGTMTKNSEHEKLGDEEKFAVSLGNLIQSDEFDDTEVIEYPIITTFWDEVKSSLTPVALAAITATAATAEPTVISAAIMNCAIPPASDLPSKEDDMDDEKMRLELHKLLSHHEWQGGLDHNHFLTVLNTYDLHPLALFTKKESDNVFQAFDADHNGLVDEDEFVNWIMKGIKTDLKQQEFLSKKSLLGKKLVGLTRVITKKIKKDNNKGTEAESKSKKEKEKKETNEQVEEKNASNSPKNVLKNVKHVETKEEIEEQVEEKNASNLPKNALQSIKHVDSKHDIFVQRVSKQLDIQLNAIHFCDNVLQQYKEGKKEKKRVLVITNDNLLTFIDKGSHAKHQRSKSIMITNIHKVEHLKKEHMIKFTYTSAKTKEKSIARKMKFIAGNGLDDKLHACLSHVTETKKRKLPVHVPLQQESSH